MIKHCTSFSLLLLVSLWGFSWGLWAQESWGSGDLIQAKQQNSENALNRLIGISEQLSTLNERLRNELQDSRRSSRELQTMLESSRRELEDLRQELGSLKQEAETLQSSSAELLIKAENSQTESTALQGALRKAESSLLSLELSFGAYRESAEKRINGLERQNRLLKWGCVAAGALAVGFGTALLLGR